MIQNNAETPQGRLNKILRVYLSPVLKENGFSKSGMKYQKIVDGYTQEISVQKSKWNKKESISFAINFSVNLPQKLATKQPHGFFASEIMGGLSILKNNQQLWINLTVEDDEKMDIQRGKTLRDLIENYALPFFTKVRGIEEIIGVLESEPKLRFSIPGAGPQREEWLSIFYFMLGQKDKAIGILDKVIDSAKIQGFKDRMIKLKKQMLLGEQG